MTNTAKLKEAIAISGFSKDQVASKLGISTHSLNRKIYNKSEFKVSEIEALRDILALTDILGIFFTRNVDLKSTCGIAEINRQSKNEKTVKSNHKTGIGMWLSSIAIIVIGFLAFTIISNQNTIMVMQTDTLNMLNDIYEFYY